MPTVPIYERTARARPILQQNITAQASASDFGAQVGQGLQNVAQGIGNLGDAYDQVEALKAETAAREARNAWMRDKDDLTYNPETGYMNQSGRNALDTRKAYEDKIKGLRTKYVEGLNPRAARMFNQAVDGLETDTFRSSAIHNGNELKQYVIQEGVAGAENFQNEALRHIDNPAMADKYLAAGLRELQEVYRKQGLPPEAIVAKEREFLSGSTKQTALTLAAKGNAGILAAQDYIEKNKDRLSAADKLALDDTMRQPLLAAKASRNMQSLISGAPVQRYDGPERPSGAVERSSIAPQARGNISSVLGSMTGLTEGRDAAAISSFIKRTAGISIDPRVTPWCAAFVNAVLATQGIEGTGKLNARSFLNFGMATDNPQPGDVVVFQRGGDPAKGHVGFFQGFDQKGDVIVTGGNQSDSVRTSTYSRADLLGFRTAGNVNENTARMPNYSPQGIAHIYDQLGKIADPDEREATRKAVDAYYTSQKKVMDAQQQQVQSWAEQQVIANPSMDINSIPIETQQALGTSGMTTLMNYQEKVRSQGQPTTDDHVLYELQTQYASNPVGFAQVDLFQYRDKLSNEDWKTVAGWRQTAMTDQRKAQEDGSLYASAFKQAEQQLAANGLTTAGVVNDPGARQAVQTRIARFQNELRVRLDDFKTQNGKTPTYVETQSMIDEILLDAVTKSKNMFGFETEGEPGFLFEMPYREDGSAFEVRVPYEDIPLEFRESIKLDLEASNTTGRKPTKEEIVAEYVRFMTGQASGRKTSPDGSW